jgi:uncharacterized protein
VTLGRFALFLLVVSGLLGLVHYYLWARLVRAPGASVRVRRGAALGLLVLAASPIVAMLSMRGPRAIAAPISWVAFTWLGLLFFLLVSTLAFDALRGLVVFIEARQRPERVDAARRTFFARAAGLAASTVAGTTGVVAAASALSSVAVKRVSVPLRALPESAAGYRIVQLTDVHIGPMLGRAWLDEIVRNVNALLPDIVVITGDLVDGSVSELREHVQPLAALKSKHGVFFVTGNHEYYSGADEWLEHLGTLGIRVLRNERLPLPCGVDLAGIDDPSGRQVPGHGSDLAGALAGRDASRPVVLLAHQPKSIFDAARLGVALQISGHTHGGQMFPFNYLVRFQQPYVAGLFDHQGTQLYVSSGTGFWGPPMRFRAPPEITEILLARAA